MMDHDIGRNSLGRPSVPHKPTDWRQVGNTPFAVTRLGFGAAQIGGLCRAVLGEVVESIVRRSDLRAEGPTGDDAPTTN